ncbi:hypothetical protein [Chitinophaga flava]|uniref:hypothetical protein n=1 Tax=Chitinophaga flava TaxID=2259036 RepID=UPI0011BF3C7A|nr:hypothetical protein [Chitinophaga flava]
MIDDCSAQVSPSGKLSLENSICTTRRLWPLVLREEACISSGRMLQQMICFYMGEYILNNRIAVGNQLLLVHC